MADLIDVATASVEVCQAEAERRARGKSAPEFHPEFDGVHCVEPDCGVEIPPGRLALGKVRCIDCQRLIEAMGSQAQRFIKINQ